MSSMWSLEKYQKVSRELRKIGDVERLSNKYGIDREVLMVIFQQKEVRRMIDMHRKIFKKKDEVFKKWLEGESIVELAEEYDFSPMLMLNIILVEMNVSKRKAKRIKKNPEILGDERLEIEIREAMEKDYLYSPKAHEEQRKRGEEGEKRLFSWLDAHGIEYMRESEMPSKEGQKTPDALLKEPVEMYGKKIYWMDSKASFGDPEEIKRSYERQFKYYVELFGAGMAIYWYGYVETNLPEGLIVVDELPEEL
jgi:hypothetical protein